MCGPASEENPESLSKVFIADCAQRFQDQLEFLARLNNILNLPPQQTPDEVVEALLNKLNQEALLLRWKQLSQTELL